jgi:hypothetical protein
VEPGELMAEVRRMARHLASFAPFVPRTMKAMVHFEWTQPRRPLMLLKYQGALGTEPTTRSKESPLSSRNASRTSTGAGNLLSVDPDILLMDTACLCVAARPALATRMSASFQKRGKHGDQSLRSKRATS